MTPAIPLTGDIVITSTIQLDEIWTIPVGRIIRFESAGFIKGIGTIKGGIIQAALSQHIFDVNLTVAPAGTYGHDFSCAWFGAKVYADAYMSIQKSIDTVIACGLVNCFLPKGNYSYTQSLKICYIYKGSYSGVGIRFYGESETWQERTVLNYTGTTGFALGIQVGKGSEIDHLVIKGTFRSPITNGAEYYNTPLASYGIENLYGLVVDYDGGKNNSGSTGCKFHDLKVSGFTYLYCVSPNYQTFNAELLTFENIQCGEGRIGFQGNQAQEKGNRIINISSWGRIHTLIQIGQSWKMQAGDYTINGGNIAGLCIRLFDIHQSGWYSTKIYNIYSESIGSIGTLQTGNSKDLPPLTLTGCTFHFATIPICGVQTLLTSNNIAVEFRGCNFRYYGLSDPMKFSGVASFTNCFWSGTLTGMIKDRPN